MLSVIMGKPKTVVTPMPTNLLVVGGSFTGRLKIYDRDTLQEVTGVDTSAMTAINSLAYDSNYIYVGGTFSAAPHARKISRTTKAISILASGAPNTALGKNCMATDAGVVYTAPTASTSGRLYRIDTAGGTPSYAPQVQMTENDLLLSGGYLYVYINNRVTDFWIRKITANPFASIAAIQLTGSAVRSLAVDSNYLYFGSSISGDFHVYDLALTTEQTGYPTIPGGIYSILNDDTNVYIGSTGYVYVINKATKALTTVNMGIASNLNSLAQTATHLYTATTGIVSYIPKATLNGASPLVTIGYGISTIMVI